METNLGQRLIDLRKKQGLTQTDLAEQLNVSVQTISKWECGTHAPTAKKLKELCDFYHVSYDYLMGSSNRSVQPAEEVPPPAVKRRKYILLGVGVGLAITLNIALLVGAYFAGHAKGVKDATPSYTVYTDVLDEEDCEGTVQLYGW